MKNMLMWISYIGLALVAFCADRITKLYALHNFVVPQHITSFISGELIFNQGISWGMLHSIDGSNFGTVSVLVLVMTFLLMYYTYKRISLGYAIYGEVLVVAGSISNMLDRFLYHGVVDFISFHYGSYAFPSFNIADCCIVVGVMIMGWQTMHEN